MEMEIVRDGVFCKIYFGDVGWQWSPPRPPPTLGKGWRLYFSGVCVIGEWGSAQEQELGAEPKIWAHYQKKIFLKWKQKGLIS